jgi:hypothetical protein
MFYQEPTLSLRYRIELIVPPPRGTCAGFLFDVSTNKPYVLRVSPVSLNTAAGGIRCIRAGDFVSTIIQFDDLKTKSLQISDVILDDRRGYFSIKVMRVGYA